MDKYTVEEKVIVCATTINVEIGKKVKVVVKLLDENKKELKTKDDSSIVKKDNDLGAIEYPFITKDLATELGVEPLAVRYVDCWIDIDDDGKIIREYDKEVMVEIIPEEITDLYFSYDEPSKPQIHKVRQGENLSLIAEQYGTTYEQIASLNKISNPNLIFPDQALIIPKDNVEEELNTIKLNGTMIPLGTKVNVVAYGTRGSTATIEVLAQDVTFSFLKDENTITQFDVTFDENGQSITPITLRPKSDEEFKHLIDKFFPSVGGFIKEEKLTLKGEINKKNYQHIYETDDRNTIGLIHYQTFIQNAYITNAHTGQVQAQLKAKQQGNDIIFLDEKNQPVASTSMDNIVNTFGNINNGLGGLAAGMEYVDGTFALKDSKGIHIKHYESGWAGNQYIKTYSMSKWANGLSKGTFWISVAVGAYQIGSAHHQDQLELENQGIKTTSMIDGIGQHTEKQTVSTALGFAGGVIIGLIALPAEAGLLLTLGTFIVVGGIVGWALSEAGSEGVELMQEIKGSTLLNDYPLH